MGHIDVTFTNRIRDGLPSADPAYHLEYVLLENEERLITAPLLELTVRAPGKPVNLKRH